MTDISQSVQLHALFKDNFMCHGYAKRKVDSLELWVMMLKLLSSSENGMRNKSAL